MKTKRVRKYAHPKYPTRLEVAARPALLHRHQPPAWRKWPELTGAAGLFLLADATRLTAADTPQKGGQTPAQANAVAVVAPIFQHGEGRGATGCMVMSPPVFLSEEEALQVITEEMTAKGVKLGTNQTEVAGMTVERWKHEVGTTRDPYLARASDPKKKVYIEFLSRRNARHWDFEREVKDGKFRVSTVQSFDMPKTTAYVAERVKQEAAEKIYFGTFYDPMAERLDFSKVAPSSEPGRTIREKMNPFTVESKRLLRLQVQDFLNWLQAQGAI